MKIGIFGSAFNPPTLGHADGVIQLADLFDEVWLVPSYAHAFGKQMVDFDKRCLMVDAFCEEMNAQSVATKGCYIEKEIVEPGKPVYSFDLLSALSERYQEHEFYLAIGIDNADGFDAFYKADEIKARWGIVVAQERKPIRSTLVRERIKAGQGIQDLVFPKVEAIMHREGIAESYK